MSGTPKPGVYNLANHGRRILHKRAGTLPSVGALAQNEVDTIAPAARAEGNKTSSAVRLRHPPSGLIVIAEESRSQHENRARALRRMRQALYLKLREELSAEELTPEAMVHRPGLVGVIGEARRLELGRKDPRYWPAVGVTLDVLQALEARVSDAAAALGISTANLVDFLAGDPKVWEQVNHMRTRFGQKPLRG